MPIRGLPGSAAPAPRVLRTTVPSGRSPGLRALLTGSARLRPSLRLSHPPESVPPELRDSTPASLVLPEPSLRHPEFHAGPPGTEEAPPPAASLPGCSGRSGPPPVRTWIPPGRGGAPCPGEPPIRSRLVPGETSALGGPCRGCRVALRSCRSICVAVSFPALRAAYPSTAFPRGVPRGRRAPGGRNPSLTKRPVPHHDITAIPPARGTTPPLPLPAVPLRPDENLSRAGAASGARARVAAVNPDLMKRSPGAAAPTHMAPSRTNRTTVPGRRRRSCGSG